MNKKKLLQTLFQMNWYEETLTKLQDYEDGQ